MVGTLAHSTIKRFVMQSSMQHMGFSMSKSREALIKRLNQLHEQLDNLPPEIVDRLANGNPPGGKYETGEVIQRLAIEVRYLRLYNKLYGC